MLLKCGLLLLLYNIFFSIEYIDIDLLDIIKYKYFNKKEKVKNPTTSVVQVLHEKNMLPAIYFTFSRKKCDENARKCSGLDLLSKEERFEVTKIIRSSSDVPIIIMTALQNEEDILKGYSLHIDDYITKPFNPKVLLAKVNNLMLRIDKESTLKMEYKIGDLSFDFINNEVKINTKKLELTKTEFNMLAFLAKNNNKVCSRQLLLDEVWGVEVYVDDRIVDAYIKKIRKQILPKKYIKTVFGVGYRFSIDE